MRLLRFFAGPSDVQGLRAICTRSIGAGPSHMKLSPAPLNQANWQHHTAYTLARQLLLACTGLAFLHPGMHPSPLYHLGQKRLSFTVVYAYVVVKVYRV